MVAINPRPLDVAAFDRTGWLLAPSVLDSATVEAARRDLDRLLRWAGPGPGRESGPGLHHFEQTEHGPALARSEDFFHHVHGLAALIVDGVIPRVLAELFGEPAVLFKEKVNFKQPGGAGFAPHQDAAAYRFVNHHISVMVPFDPATTSSGCLWVADRPGPGQLLPNERGRISAGVAARLNWAPVELDVGDVLFFDSFTPHYSETNRTERPRRAAYLTFNAASAGDHRDAYYADKRAEFGREGDRFEGGRLRLSISDDFLGVPVDGSR